MSNKEKTIIVETIKVLENMLIAINEEELNNSKKECLPVQKNDNYRFDHDF